MRWVADVMLCRLIPSFSEIASAGRSRIIRATDVGPPARPLAAHRNVTKHVSRGEECYRASAALDECAGLPRTLC